MMRWAAMGTLLGGLVAGLAFAPASWLAGGLSGATGQRLMLADARGTVWQGSAVLVLTGGEGSHDASALPGRLHWTLGLDGLALALGARHACCINGELRVRIVPGLAGLRIELPAVQGPIGQWPAAWLVGLGTPWNTVQPSGSLQLSSNGLSMESVQGRWRFKGQAVLELGSIASRLSTLPVLGSYRLQLRETASAGESAAIELMTTSGALQLSGSGQWAASRFRFSGQASAAVGAEAALNNLLNIIGRRKGALSLISIG